jgi:hypothetical protein
MAPARIDCHRCAHYFVTWDPCFPHGCRCMGFKSRLYPSEEVRQTMSGRECRLFHAKSGSVGLPPSSNVAEPPGDGHGGMRRESRDKKTLLGGVA